MKDLLTSLQSDGSSLEQWSDKFGHISKIAPTSRSLALFKILVATRLPEFLDLARNDSVKAERMLEFLPWNVSKRDDAIEFIGSLPIDPNHCIELSKYLPVTSLTQRAIGTVMSAKSTSNPLRFARFFSVVSVLSALNVRERYSSDSHTALDLQYLSENLAKLRKGTKVRWVDLVRKESALFKKYEALSGKTEIERDQLVQPELHALEEAKLRLLSSLHALAQFVDIDLTNRDRFRVDISCLFGELGSYPSTLEQTCVEDGPEILFAAKNRQKRSADPINSKKANTSRKPGHTKEISTLTDDVFIVISLVGVGTGVIACLARRSEKSRGRHMAHRSTYRPHIEWKKLCDGLSKKVASVSKRALLPIKHVLSKAKSRAAASTHRINQGHATEIREKSQSHAIGTRVEARAKLRATDAHDNTKLQTIVDAPTPRADTSIQADTEAAALSPTETGHAEAQTDAATAPEVRNAETQTDAVAEPTIPETERAEAQTDAATAPEVRNAEAQTDEVVASPAAGGRAILQRRLNPDAREFRSSGVRRGAGTAFPSSTQSLSYELYSLSDVACALSARLDAGVHIAAVDIGKRCELRCSDKPTTSSVVILWMDGHQHPHGHFALMVRKHQEPWTIFGAPLLKISGTETLRSPQVQAFSNNCGPWCVEMAAQHLGGKPVPEHLAHVVHNRLISGDSPTRMITTNAQSRLYALHAEQVRSIMAKVDMPGDPIEVMEGGAAYRRLQQFIHPDRNPDTAADSAFINALRDDWNSVDGDTKAQKTTGQSWLRPCTLALDSLNAGVSVARSVSTGKEIPAAVISVVGIGCAIFAPQLAAIPLFASLAKTTYEDGLEVAVQSAAVMAVSIAAFSVPVVGAPLAFVVAGLALYSNVERLCREDDVCQKAGEFAYKALDGLCGLILIEDALMPGFGLGVLA